MDGTLSCSRKELQVEKMELDVEEIVNHILFEWHLIFLNIGEKLLGQPQALQRYGVAITQMADIYDR
ncbi:hypothetical protein OPV22_016514 [Ensete ventricosum]|uniref:Uncharacterized protein n=1 Tax=Ensete ventricosum TaxID=4639 RepID=A0AAV8QL92_ENSVE|nr:hypothetical protein OPV22_016514 [Ensete ventricosum]